MLICWLMIVNKNVTDQNKRFFETHDLKLFYIRGIQGYEGIPKIPEYNIDALNSFLQLHIPINSKGNPNTERFLIVIRKIRLDQTCRLKSISRLIRSVSLPQIKKL